MPTKRKRPKKRTPAGEQLVPLTAIQAGVSYPLADFQRLTGLGDYAMRQARRNGLKVHYVGRLGFVVGDDWIDWLRSKTDPEPG